MGQNSFDPGSDQQQFMESTAKQVMGYGGFGSGKTRTMNEKGYMLNMKYPGNRGLIVRKNFSDVRSSTIEQSLLEDVIPESHIPEDGWNKSEHRIEHFTGATDQYGEPVMSEIYYEGLSTSGNRSDDALPRRVSGMQFGWIAIDEATETTEGDYVQLLGRLRYNQHEQGGQIFQIPFRQIMVSTNPAGPEHYLNRRFLQDVEDDVEAFKLRPENNPGIPDDYVQDMKDNYSGVYYERYVEGNWVGTENVVYDEFDRRRFVLSHKQLHEIDEGWTESEEISERGVLTPPDEWNVYRVIDFGYPSPTVIQFFAQSPANSEGDRMYVMFREVYQSEMMIEDICEDYIKPYSRDLNIEEMYADPAQADSRETLSRRGIETVSANKDVWAGIQEVKAQMDCESLQNPGVLFFEDALVHREDQDLNEANKPARTVDEFAGYEWSDNTDDEPVKEDDHGMDCMRYLVYTLEGDSGPSYDELEEFANSVKGGF